VKRISLLLLVQAEFKHSVKTGANEEEEVEVEINTGKPVRGEGRR